MPGIRFLHFLCICSWLCPSCSGFLNSIFRVNKPITQLTELSTTLSYLFARSCDWLQKQSASGGCLLIGFDKPSIWSRGELIVEMLCARFVVSPSFSFRDVSRMRHEPAWDKNRIACFAAEYQPPTCIYIWNPRRNLCFTNEITDTQATKQILWFSTYQKKQCVVLRSKTRGSNDMEILEWWSSMHSLHIDTHNCFNNWIHAN